MFRLGVQYFAKFSLQQASLSQIKAPTLAALQLKAVPIVIGSVRTTSFFKKLNAERTWKSILSVSNPGKRRGRGNTIKKRAKIDLNKGQVIGVGKVNIRWPGLNTNVLQGQDVLEIQKLPDDPDFKTKIIQARNENMRRRKMTLHPLERGWTARSICGRRLGPPEMNENEKAEGLDSTIVEFKMMKKMDPKMGRTRVFSAYALAGNGRGILGVGGATAAEMKTAVRKARKRAALRLTYFKFEDPNTINHDFFYQFGLTKVFAYRRPAGYGLVCHRAIGECCKFIGLKDIYVKVEGSKNLKNIVKAFLLGLLDQKTYQQIADECKLHVVEQRRDRSYYPVVLASPSEVAEMKSHDLMFNQYVMGGQLPIVKSKRDPLEYLPNFAKFLKKTHYLRNHRGVRLKLLAEYGECKSFLADVYPECTGNVKKQQAEKEATA